MEVFNIALRGIFIDNMIFAYYLGMCSFLAVSKKVETAFGLGLAVVFVLTLTVPVNWLLQEYVLKEGALTWIDGSFESIDLTFLQFIMFIAVIASMVQLVEMIIEKLSPALYGSLGIFLPLIAVNCAILGSSLFMVQKDYNIIEATSYGFGSGFGFLTSSLLNENSIYFLISRFCIAISTVAVIELLATAVLIDLSFNFLNK